MSLLQLHLDRPLPNLLYHYTSQQGLLGIVAERKVRATMIHYLNDSAEYVHALDVLKARLTLWTEDGQQGKSIVAERARQNVETIRTLNVFVGSFTRKGDLLSQWRAYCPPTGGYSVAFVSGRLQACMHELGYNFAACVYDDSEKVKMIDDLLDRSLEAYNDDGRDGWLGIMGWATTEFVLLASLFKDQSFDEEAEYRIVAPLVRFNDEGVKYRPGASAITPYLEAKLETETCDFPLHHVIVGPTPHPDLAKRAVEGVLFQAGLGVARGEEYFVVEEARGVTTQISKIPYRTW